MIPKLTSGEILSIVRKFGIQYEDKDRYIKFRCINENHDDNNPSMTMLKNNGFCKCWSCGATYNFYAFVTKVSNGDYRKYIKNEDTLSRVFNQTLSENEMVIDEETFFKEPKREMKITQGKLFSPLRSTVVMDYLRKINVDKNMIEEFDIRYSQTAYITFSDTGKGSFIKNRICIPILEKEKIINMECRDYTEQQKHKVIYPKGSKADMLWNWNSIDLNKDVYVVEGIKGAFRIYKHISKNVVATLGSAIGNNQKKLLNKIKKLMLFPDNDEAGKTMIDQINKFYDHDYKIIFMQKKDYDPADGSIRDLEYAIANPILNIDWFLMKYDFYNKRINRKISWG